MPLSFSMMYCAMPQMHGIGMGEHPVIFPDTFVKLTLKLENKKIKQKKTSVRKATINPYFNETFVFDVPMQQIKVCCEACRIASDSRKVIY